MTTVSAESASEVGVLQLIERVIQGEEIELTRAGVAVVRLIPITDLTRDAQQPPIEDLLNLMHEIRGQNGPLGDEVKTLTHEGHRY